MPRPTHPYIPMAHGFAYLVAIIDWSLSVIPCTIFHVNPRRLPALQVAADRSDCRRQRARYFTLATAARVVQSQSF